LAGVNSTVDARAAAYNEQTNSKVPAIDSLNVVQVR
jgi:hypothetical protein